MADSLSINSDDLRTAAANVADLSSEMKQVLTALQGQLAALGSPWGNDSTGDQFANGSDGYLAQVNNVDSNIDATTRQLDSLSQSLTTAASNFEQQDQQSSGGTGNILLGNGSGGGTGSGGGSGGNSGSGGSGGGSGSGGSGGGTGSGGPGQLRATVRSDSMPLLPESARIPAQPAEPVIAGANSTGSGTGQLTPRIQGTLLPATPGVPAQPAVAAGNVLASGAPTATGPSGGLSPLLPAVPAVPAVPATPGSPEVPAVPAQPAGVTQPATTPQILTSNAPAAATAEPGIATGNVLADAVPEAATSTPGSDLSALIQTLEQLAEPAGEGVSTAMGAIPTGSKGSGNPSTPAPPGATAGSAAQ